MTKYLFEVFQHIDCLAIFHYSNDINLFKIAMWLNQNFHLPNELDVKTELNVSFLSLRDNTKFTITMVSDELVIWTHNMGLAGDLIQSLAAFLNIEDLQVLLDS